LQVNGWIWRKSFQVKLARFRRPKAACFLWYMECRPNTNATILWKTGHIKERSHTRSGVLKKEVEVNIVDVHSWKNNKEFFSWLKQS
jgi:hypothetical protein